MQKNNITKAWMLYERGRAYNNRLIPNQYSLVNTNIDFFAGNQWINIPQTPAMSRLPKPVFNIIKRITSLFVASLTSSAVAINFEPLSYYGSGQTPDGGDNIADYANAEVANLLEKFKMDYRIREALFDGAQTGDYCAHFYWDASALPYGGSFGEYRGEIKMELVDGINVMFGNPNDSTVENQPYILVIGRDSVENLREEALQHKKQKSGESVDDMMIRNQFIADGENYGQAAQGGKVELESDDEYGKALYVYLYTKSSHEEDVIDPGTGEKLMEDVFDKNGKPVYEKDKSGNPVIDMNGNRVPKRRPVKRTVTSVHVTKATKTAVIFEDIDTGLTRYPIAWGNWEKQKNQYHGRALITGIIPNQIFINSMFAMVMRHLQLLGFPKTVYNADLIGKWSNEIGQAIAVRGLQPNQAINSVAYNLQPADMSNQIIMAIDKAVAYTKECLGATDAQMGNIKPDNTSAIMVLQSSSEVPLENVRAGMYEWMEDIGAILLDMIGTYYGKRPIIREKVFEEPQPGSDGAPMLDPVTGKMISDKVPRKVVEEFDFTRFKNLWLNLRIDSGATNYFSEIAMTQTLDNLRINGVLDIIDYLERVPDKLIPRRQELIDKLKQKAQMPTQEAQNAPGGQMPM